jgi:uncharacterized membrane protein
MVAAAIAAATGAVEAIVTVAVMLVVWLCFNKSLLS